MMVNEFPACCSAVLISGFYDYGREDQLPKKQQILKKIKEYFEQYFYNDEIAEYPTTFFATTNSQSQYEWEIALKELGFRARKYASRHAKRKTHKYLNFWYLYAIPKDMKPWLKEQLKLQKERIKDDSW